MNDIIDLRQKNNKDEHKTKKEDQYLTGNTREEKINPQRREFLKFILIGIGGFFLGRLFGLIIKLLRPQYPQDILINTREPRKNITISQESTKSSGPRKETELKNWKIIEKNNQITFIDKKTNEEVLILD